MPLDNNKDTRFSRPLVITCTVRGQIRHRRRLSKDLFFIDVLIHDDKNVKEQILFRSDDGTMTRDALMDVFRSIKLGDVIAAQVGLPTDPSEYEQKPYKVWQSNMPVTVTHQYNAAAAPSGRPFMADPPLGSSGSKPTLRQWDGSRKQKSEIYCKFWISQRACRQLPDCPFLHPAADGDAYREARKHYMLERLEIRRRVTHNPDDPHHPSAKKSHALRAMVFAQWIYQTFGGDLVRGGGILDVAGGKGEVSMFLTHGYGVPCTVVEPEIRKRPKHWYNRIRRLTCRMVHHQSPDCTAPLISDQWPHDLEPVYMATWLDDHFLEDHPGLIQNTALLVGMHADQATEPIVDTALKLGKAFAVVPCCVFGHENRHRRLSNGQPVATTQDLIQYLCEKDERIQKSYLGFEGKNVVVHWRPS